jgi:hypothetical protein
MANYVRKNVDRKRVIGYIVNKDEPIPEERQAEYITINFSVKGKMVEPTEQHMNYSKKYLTKAKEIWGERNGIK